MRNDDPGAGGSMKEVGTDDLYSLPTEYNIHHVHNNLIG